VLPVLRHAVGLGVPISVDTYKPEVMREALDLGADIVNDISALRHPGAREQVARHPSCGVCLMHMHGEPQTMQRAPMQGDAVPQVVAFLARAAQALRDMGVEASRIVWDPGIGFGKTVEQNFALLARQHELLEAGHPLVVGWSRKSSLGSVTGLPVHERLAPSIAAAVLAVQRGAHVVRVHDVKETLAALKVLGAMVSIANNQGLESNA
jgi:dihydropteroate synthase